MKFPIVLQNDDGIRPAGKPDECFYCNQKVGTEHLRDCVCIRKIIKVRYSLELEVDVPWFWTPEDFEFDRNESSWCADNALSDLQKYHDRIDQDGCTCVFCKGFKAEYLDIVDATPRGKERPTTEGK